MYLDVSYNDLYHMVNALIDYKFFLGQQGMETQHVERIIAHLQTVLDQDIRV